tara:strand:- start:2327 stop:3118 length:792 start_codon:yes stop_codon:yes gene_type:complete
MSINFSIKGRLGNAIFRYMACSVLCIISNKKYECSNVNKDKPLKRINDQEFFLMATKLLNNEKIIMEDINYILTEYYQHDNIYKLFKDQIIEFVNNNRDHIIITDGINAGDGRYQIYKMYDIVNTNINFNKKYKNVLHIRLDDFVYHNLYLNVDRIIKLLKKNIINDNLCIVCKKCETSFEKNYLNTIKSYLENNNIAWYIESNDTITDYYIMKESEILICSKSTLSWCAAFFSNTIKQCYLPDYIEKQSMTCKNPINNTILY